VNKEISYGRVRLLPAVLAVRVAPGLRRIAWVT
jgi:hypothetical protein